MAQTGHRSLPVLRGHVRRGSLFADNAAAKVGLWSQRQSRWWETLLALLHGSNW